MPKWFLMTLAALLMLAGCRESAQPTATPSAAVNIALALDPDPPVVGDGTLLVTLTDAAGAPIDGAAVAVRGDMNHAGMRPVERSVRLSENGVYRVPFLWSMGGDWILTVTVTLPDGETVEREFTLAVES